MDYTKTGQLIRRLRLELGMTQRELADRLHICSKTVSKWECGHGFPEVSMFPALSEALNADFSALFSGEIAQKSQDSGNLRRLQFYVCPECGNEIFPVIAPAVIVAVTHGDQILVTRYAGREHKGIALIAGFCEIGERTEDTVHREVMEEAGVRVKNLRYFDSQPWGFASNLLLGYFAELDGSPEIHMDEEELQEARWVKRGELPVQENLASLTATMIEHFRQGKV